MKPIPAVRKRRPSPKGEAVTHVLILAALAVVTALAYSNSFRSGFIVDNRVLMLDPRIRALTAENLRLILSKDYWYGLSGSGLYRPLSSLSYLFNCAILGNGMRPAGYHWLNLLLHILNVSMVYVLGLIVMGKRDRAAALAALWGLHPVLTESVTNIIGRADLLSTCGVLAGLLSYIAIGGSSGGRRTVWLIALLLASAVGVFSKESGTVLPGAMLIYDLTVKFAKFGDRRSIPQFPAAASADTSWRSRAPAYLCAAVPICVFWFVRGRVMAGLPGMHPGFGDNPLVGGGFWNSRLTAVKVLGKYLGLLAWPARLSPDYSYNQVPLLNWPLHTWDDWQAPLALALYLAAAVLAFVSYRRGRTVFFFVAFFFVTMAPTSNLIVQIGTIMAERFLYLPSIGFAGCVVIAVYAFGERIARPSVAPAILAAICLVLAARTWVRNSDWLDDLSLWSNAVRSAPASYKSHMALASALASSGAAHLDDAIAEIEQAFAILKGLPDERNSPAPYIDGGSYYGQKGESVGRRNPDGSLAATTQSLAWYRKALDILLHARRIQAANNLASLRFAQMRGVVHKDAGWYELYLELGAVYFRLSEPRKALEVLQQGRKYKPVPEFFERAADARNALGDVRGSAIDLAAAVLMDPGDARMTARLAQLYQRSDPSGCQIRADRQGLNLDCPTVHDDFCAGSAEVAEAYREAGLDAAARTARQAADRELHCTAGVRR